MDFYLAEDSTGTLYLLYTFNRKDDTDIHCTICLYDSDEESDEESEQNILKPTLHDTQRYCQMYKGVDEHRQPVCKHIFHTVCLYDWFKSSKKILCPLCKQGMTEPVSQLPQLYQSPPIKHRIVTFFGNLVIFETVDDQKHGEYSEFYGSGTLHPKIKCCYVRGLLDGEYRHWFENGQLKEVSHWKDGRQVGSARCYNIRGKPTLVINFDMQGLYHGWYKTYDALHGRLIKKGKYNHGKKRGPWKYWFLTNRRLKAWMSYDHNGLLHGKFLTWHLSGYLERFTTYRHGVQIGLERAWYSSGAIWTWKYRNPMTLSLEGLEVTWHPNGQVYHVRFHDNGMMVGPVLEWDTMGRIVRKHQYINDVKHGKQITYVWHQDKLQQKTIEKYKRGVRHGAFVHKFSDGTKEKGQYQQGELVGKWSRIDKDGEEIYSTEFQRGVPVNYHLSDKLNRMLIPFARILKS